jgi:hypothetical protein
MIKIRTNINASDIDSDFEPEPFTNDDENDSFHYFNSDRRGGQPPRLQKTEEKGLCRVNETERNPMVKINIMDSVIDPKFLKLNSAVNKRLKFPDSIYGSSSSISADRH